MEIIHHGVARPTLAATLVRIALNRPARAAYVAVGTVGLAALTVAFIGPRRLEREVLKPLRGAIEPQAEKSGPSRSACAIRSPAWSRRPAGCEKLARSFQSWIGHFRAT